MIFVPTVLYILPYLPEYFIFFLLMSVPSGRVTMNWQIYLPYTCDKTRFTATTNTMMMFESKEIPCQQRSSFHYVLFPLRGRVNPQNTNSRSYKYHCSESLILHLFLCVLIPCTASRIVNKLDEPTYITTAFHFTCTVTDR